MLPALVHLRHWAGSHTRLVEEEENEADAEEADAEEDTDRRVLQTLQALVFDRWIAHRRVAEGKDGR